MSIKKPAKSKECSTHTIRSSTIYQVPLTKMEQQQHSCVRTPIHSRAIEHQLAIQDELNYLAQKVGLGNEYYRLEKGRVMTATQVISEKSDTFRNKKRHEKPLKKGILDIIESFMRLYNEVIEANTFSEEDIKTLDVRFDDSIIEDTESQKTSDRIDVDKGIMSRIEYRVKWYGEDEKDSERNHR